ncbi:THAP domain-containing protein 3-like [Gadus macrocephalus]|uniref:THAP domain-containing protein 3-like n=1 Tax=Gadus macrocephalus TaxID=80720 RepID=UPI0028CB798B|nr:THAP domain-containing protein 3-like [Gadus macrocephalus]
MAPHCCVPQCTSSHRKKSNRGQTFHRFANDLGLRREWIIKIKRDPGRHFKINTYTKVCSEHFLPDCLVKTKTGITKLKQGAVPTVFAWSSFRPERRSVVRTASKVSTDHGECVE